MHAWTHWTMQLAHTNATHEQMIDDALNHNSHHRHHHSYFECQNIKDAATSIIINGVNAQDGPNRGPRNSRIRMQHTSK